MIVIPLISIPYLSRVLLEDGIGVYSYSESIVSYFTLVAVLGSTTYAQREIGKVQNNVEERSRLFWEIFIIRLLASIIAIGGYSIYLCFQSDNLLIALIFGLNIFNVLFDLTWFFQGVEDFGKVTAIGFVFKLLDFAFIFIFVKQQSDLWIYVIGKCGFVLLGNICMWLFLPKYLCRVKNLKPFKHLKTILVFFVPTVAIQVYTILDKSMIGWFTGNASENGYYDYSEKIIRMSITIISALTVVLIPRISKAYAENNMDNVKCLVNNAVSFVWLLALPLMFGFLSISDILVPVYLGENFMKSVLLMNIFAPLILFVGMANIIGVAFLISIDKQNVYIIFVIISAIVNIILNLILIPKFASVGAAISSVIAEGIGITLQIVYVFKKKLLSPKFFFSSSIKSLISSVIMFAVLYLLKIFVFPVAIWSLIVLTIIGILLYFISLLILRDKFLLNGIRQGLRLIKTKFSKKVLVDDAVEKKDEDENSSSE